MTTRSKATGGKRGKKTKASAHQLLLSTSEACQKHCSHHEDGLILNPEGLEVPPFCQASLESITKVLPKLEAIVLPADVPMLCRFYTQALKGGFCPSAPKLFSHRVDGTLCHLATCLSPAPPVHTRILLLLEHSLSCNNETASQIVNTISLFVSFYTEKESAADLLHDLIAVACDVSLQLEANEREDVELILFSDDDDSTLSVSNWDELLRLQQGLFQVLHQTETNVMAQGISIWRLVEPDYLDDVVVGIRQVLSYHCCPSRTRVAALRLLKRLLEVTDTKSLHFLLANATCEYFRAAKVSKDYTEAMASLFSVLAFHVRRTDFAATLCQTLVDQALQFVTPKRSEVAACFLYSLQTLLSVADALPKVPHQAMATLLECIKDARTASPASCVLIELTRNLKVARICALVLSCAKGHRKRDVSPCRRQEGSRKRARVDETLCEASGDSQPPIDCTLSVLETYISGMIQSAIDSGPDESPTVAMAVYRLVWNSHVKNSTPDTTEILDRLLKASSTQLDQEESRGHCLPLVAFVVKSFQSLGTHSSSRIRFEVCWMQYMKEQHKCFDGYESILPSDVAASLFHSCDASLGSHRIAHCSYCPVLRISFGVEYRCCILAYTHLDDEDHRQRERLALVAPRLNGKGDFSLYEDTVKGLTSLQSTVTRTRSELLCMWQCVVWWLRCCSPRQLNRMPFEARVQQGQATKDARAFVVSLFNTVMNDVLTHNFHDCSFDAVHVCGREFLSHLLEEGDDCFEKLCFFSYTIQDETQHQLSSSESITTSSSKSVDLEHSSSYEIKISFLCSMASGCLLSNAFVISFARLISLWSGENSKRRMKQWLCYTKLVSLRNCHKIQSIRKCTSNHSALVSTVFRKVLTRQPGAPDAGWMVGMHMIPCEVKASSCVLLSQVLQIVYFDSTLDMLPRCFGELATSDQLQRHLERLLPRILAQLINESDYDTLRLVACLKLFMMALTELLTDRSSRLNKAGVRQHQDVDSLLTEETCWIRSRTIGKAMDYDMEEQAGRLCFSTGVFEKIIALFFQEATAPHIRFFNKVVLRERNPSRLYMKNRERSVLKALVWEAGDRRKQEANRALCLAALARNEDVGSDGVINEESLAAMQKPVAIWVSSHFMYLIVNLVQSKWRSKDSRDRVQALSCLKYMLGVLDEGDAPQYFPQILTAYNSAVSVEESCPTYSELQALAVDVFSSFIRLVAKGSYKTLSQNLDVVVVSLVPMVESKSACLSKAKNTALETLEWLVSGSLGEQLSSRFAQIPFLPSIPELDGMKHALRSLGVDNDSIISTQGSHERLSRNSEQTEVEEATKQNSLRSRIATVCKLLPNENAGIRKVVLLHLKALLVSNRLLFSTLVENEGDSSLRHFITVSKANASVETESSVTDLLEMLLDRCVHETNKEVRALVGSCLGEIGAVGAHLLQDRASQSKEEPHRRQPPWHSRADRHQLYLVTDPLVAALKSATSSVDQHKIGYSMQQLLALLDRSAIEGGSQPETIHEGKPSMSKWLTAKLSEAGVIDVVEPFWSTEFRETDKALKLPPFFETSSSYFGWLSSWCRYMALRSFELKPSKWSELFHACASAMRTPVGVSITEYLLPFVILDRLCFGDGNDEQVVVKELCSALTFCEASEKRVPHSERQKVVKTILDVIDVLQYWNEKETESKRTKNKKKTDAQMGWENWPVEESIMRINDVLTAVPLSLQAVSARKVGMHARSLRLFELLARSNIVDTVFNGKAPNHVKWTRSRAAGDCGNLWIEQVKEVLGALNDNDTISCLMDNERKLDPLSRLWGSIKHKEAYCNWDGALQDYERALQLYGSSDRNPVIFQAGALRCLLELGHFDSVVNQANGLVRQGNQAGDETIQESLPIAIEASWRLGNWESLSSLLEEAESIGLQDKFEVLQGNLINNLKRQQYKKASLHLQAARMAVMDSLTVSASEGHERAYGDFVRLQSLTECEDVYDWLSQSKSPELGVLIDQKELAWNRRLANMSHSGVSSVLNTRIVLARLAGDASFEADLFLRMGSLARADGDIGMSANALAQAEAVIRRHGDTGQGSNILKLHLQLATLKHSSGDCSAALRMLQSEKIGTLTGLEGVEARSEAVKCMNNIFGDSQMQVSEDEMLLLFAKSSLRSNLWMIEGGLKSGSEIMSRFRTLHKVAPKFHEGHFHFAKYVDSILKSRIAVLVKNSSYAGSNDEERQNAAVAEDEMCQRYILLAMRHFVESLALDTKNVFQTLPRLLSLWFDFTSIDAELGNKHSNNIRVLLSNQDDCNAFMAQRYKQVPVPAFYTALPQLVSRITHCNSETTPVVRSILRRVLTKYPAQAMWPLAWLRQSRQRDRCKAGEEIFREAEQTLMKSPNRNQYAMLVASQGLCVYFHKLAKFEMKNSRASDINVRPWKGEVDLAEFVPPVQAALSASMSVGDSSRTRDLFPRHVPRMRSFDQKVKVMHSKARPKIIRAHVVSSNAFRLHSVESLASGDHDIGEIHFLVKQEAKGDLRKDARVQDLNNVINRLMSTNQGKAQDRQRRLRLRTFAVTCLSEDSGILEWVPNTSSLRSIIGKTYNPQASPFSGRRSGHRLANFGDPMLKTNYEKCQSLFFNSRDLKGATRLFEDLCLKPNPPLLYWWFVQTFRDPHTWYEARTRFAQSSAIWSAVCHIIGIGDRHAENILIDTESGECVHVDFDCIFDKGLNLPKPEVIPFRLTQNMLDGFGPTGADGVFTGNLQVAMHTLRHNRDTLLSVLEPFLKDPIIDWKRYRSQQQKRDSTPGAVQQAREAKRSINVIDERLRGIYNVRNPNYKAMRRKGHHTSEDDEELTHVIPLSVEGQVQKMISEATSNENLIQMYVGWMPWI